MQARQSPFASLASWALVLAAAALPMDRALAAGFFVQEQSATGVGRANAGAAAVADDLATMFFNPAGLTELPGPAVAVGGHLIIPRVRIENDGSTANGPLTRGPVAFSGSDDEPFDPVPIGNVYAAAPVFDGRAWLGLAVTAPFGLVTEYDESFFGRYDSIKSTLLTIDIAPTAACALSDWVSFGLGLDVQYADAELVNAIPNPTALGGPTPETDGRFRVTGDDWSVGFNAGVLVKPTTQMRLGLHYRSAITHELRGVSAVSGFRGALADLNGKVGGSSRLNLPDTLSVGIAYEFTDRVTLLTQGWYFGWNRFDEIRVDFDNTREDQVSVENYRSTFAISMGGEYQFDDNWVLRSGFQYDQTPTVDGFRTTRVPDGDRYWLALGATYRLKNDVALDIGYAHLFVEDSIIDRTDVFFEGSPLAVVTRIRGNAEGGSADILSLQLSADF